MKKLSKEIIKKIILSAEEDFKRFELIESYASYANNPADVRFLVRVLRKDVSSVVRHEAAAQLLKVEQKKPWLMYKLKEYVINQLLVVAMHDKSLVARHESVEALSYIGDKSVLGKINKIINSEKKNSEIIETLKIARDIIEFRIIKGIKDVDDIDEAILNDG